MRTLIFTTLKILEVGLVLGLAWVLVKIDTFNWMQNLSQNQLYVIFVLAVIAGIFLALMCFKDWIRENWKLTDKIQGKFKKESSDWGTTTIRPKLQLKYRLKNIFRDVICYDVASIPGLSVGGKDITILDVVRCARENKIWVYSSENGNAPTVLHRSIFSIRKPKFIDSKDLTKEQIDKLLKL